MGRTRKQYYNQEDKENQLKYYSTLPEKQQRHFLGFEYKRLGSGSQRYLSELFGCSRGRIRRALQEIESAGFKPDYAKQRKLGGGRKKRREQS